MYNVQEFRSFTGVISYHCNMLFYYLSTLLYMVPSPALGSTETAQESIRHFCWLGTVLRAVEVQWSIQDSSENAVVLLGGTIVALFRKTFKN